MLTNKEKLSDKDLEQVSGGGVYAASWEPRFDDDRVWYVIDDTNGSIIDEIHGSTRLDGILKAQERATQLGMSTKSLRPGELEALRNGN